MKTIVMALGFVSVVVAIRGGTAALPIAVIGLIFASVSGVAELWSGKSPDA